MTVTAIIVAAGQGTRAGGAQPKQLQLLGRRTVLNWSIDTFQAHQSVTKTVVVVPAGQRKHYRDFVPETVHVVEGGRTRSDSVRNGLAALDLGDDDLVMIHDAARPGLDRHIIDALLDAMQRADAACPALPVVDALKRQTDDGLSNLDRLGLFRIQTPQVFRSRHISAALNQTGQGFVDDLEAIEALGLQVKLTRGHERLSKITYPGDLERIEQMIAPQTMVPRVGNGFDVHGFEDGDFVTLCGIEIPHTQKLSGHSDADVAWHSLTDAILGAAALGDIGDHFPPSDQKWKGAASAIFLEHAIAAAKAAGYGLASCDLTIICEAPKIGPHRNEMRERTAEITGLPLTAISIKATTTEKLGFTGRGEGIAAMASAVLYPLPKEG